MQGQLQQSKCRAIFKNINKFSWLEGEKEGRRLDGLPRANS
jgi:hypothetical protein